MAGRYAFLIPLAADRPLFREAPSGARTIGWCPAQGFRPRRHCPPRRGGWKGDQDVQRSLSLEVAVCCLGERFGPRSGGVTADVFRRREAVTRSTTDAGSLIGQSPSALGLGVQRQNPIVNDPRSAAAGLAACRPSGSYWVPARMDSGYDAQQDRLPDSQRRDHDQRPLRRPVRSGLLLYRLPNSSPRPVMEEAFQAFGSTGFDCKVNGEQWSGRQTAVGRHGGLGLPGRLRPPHRQRLHGGRWAACERPATIRGILVSRSAATSTPAGTSNSAICV